MLKSERGFTMIELLLVLLGAVLFANIGLSAHKATSRMNLFMTAREIQTLIRQTQDKAYGEQAMYELGFYTLTGRCIQIKDNRITDEISIPRGITIERTNFPGRTLKFNGKLVPSGGGTILLYSKSHQVRITVLPVTGRVKIYPVDRK